MPHALIDGDQVVFKGAAACEEEVRWDEENHVLCANEERTMRNVEAMLRRLFERFSCDEDGYTLCFSGAQPYFREAIAPGYKAGRPRKPLCYKAIKERLFQDYHCWDRAGLEADDVMGILATAGHFGSARVIVSQDKDMRTVPATVWNGKDLITYTEAEADYWHLFQTLTGDAVDGYKGCPGVGPVTAKKLLAKPTWAAVKQAYEKAGLTEEDALAQARLARILRWSDWDSKKRKPILWSPALT